MTSDRLYVNDDACEAPLMRTACAALQLTPESALGHFVLFAAAVRRRLKYGELPALPDAWIESAAQWQGNVGMFARFIRDHCMSGDSFVPPRGIVRWQSPGASQIRRPYIPKIVRTRVFDRDGHRCRMCGSTARLTLDHIVPVSRGGRDEESNLRTLCLWCNSKRGARCDT